MPREKVAPFLNNQSPEQAFDNAENAAATCEWLNLTFNGDLLPLPNNDLNNYFNHYAQSELGQKIFKTLTAILHFDDPLGSGCYQRRLDWQDLHLGHVPVGLLSQVYERHMELFHPKMRKATSAYYTPRYLAELMVDEAFYGLEQAHLAKALDPASGAGVFLVAAFNKLVKSRWQYDGKRPDRTILRHILNHQIRGFDVNCHALKLSALSLYLISLELDPDPYPIEALRFDTLQGTVLFDLSGQTGTQLEPSENPVAGSLGKLVGEEHDSTYDIVIGNPPWSTHAKGHPDLKKLYTDVSRAVAKQRGIPDAENYDNPDAVPDLPFVWRAMQWARPGGRIALALHGRWLFKQSAKGIQSRNAILQALQITGILNGAALLKTKVWPNVQVPFCLVFAENRIPSPDAGFFFVSPQLDPTLNKEGRLRIDAQAAEPVANQDVINNPWLLKSLFRGNRLSSEIIEQLIHMKVPTIEEYWQENGLALGNGFKITSSGKQNADFLSGRINVIADYADHPFLVNPETLAKFEFKTVNRRRDKEIYDQPLVLIKLGFRYDRNRGRALLVRNIEEIAYCESYTGLSCFGHPYSEQLSQYIFLLFNSKLVFFFFLSTSSKFGVERDVLLTEDITRVPFVPLEQLSTAQQQNIEQLAIQIVENPASPPWHEVDALIEEIYAINPWQRQIINDTLETNLPEGSPAAKLAALPSNPEQKQKFIATLLASMEPFFIVTGRTLNIHFCTKQTKPWLFLDINANHSSQSTPEELDNTILEKADDLMVSRIIQTFENNPSCLRIGILDQARYWTPTQARLLASDLLRNYGHQLEQGC